MVQARAFVLYSTIVGLFGTAAYFTAGSVMIQAFYLLIVLNLLLIMAMKKLWAPRGYFLTLAFLVVVSSIGIVRGVDTMPRFVKEFLGIGVTLFYFCSFFRAIDFDFDEALSTYARMAYYVAILGILLYPIRLLLTGEYRLRSVLTEPSMFVLTCIPAVYFFADQWQRNRTYGRELIVMLIAFVMAGSSNGFLGLLLGVAIFVMRYKRLRILLPAVLLAVGSLLYFSFSDVSLRINDSVRAIQGADLTGTNFSTWALFSNALVTKEVLAEHPLVGNGLGSHGMSYEKYIGTVAGADAFVGTDGEGLNAEDANSLALRVLSDSGYIGALLVVWIIWRYRPTGTSQVDVMSKAMWLYFFIKLLRGGQYFSNEQYFFILFYVLSRTKFADAPKGWQRVEPHIQPPPSVPVHHGEGSWA